MRLVRKWMKVALDVIIFVLLALMYRKQAVSMAFHEIGGLALIALFVVHHIVNAGWIAAVTRRLFVKQTPLKTRIAYVVDALLLVAFLCIGVSGALISKKVFSFNLHGGGWKTLHYFCSALALTLIGVHVGLHAAYLFGSLRKQRRSVRLIATALLAALLVFGVYNLATTSYFRWMSMPFSLAANEGGGPGRGNGAAEAPGELAGAHGASGGESGAGWGRDGNGQKAGLRGSGGGVTAALTVLAQYASIASVFAALTAGIERLCRRGRKRGGTLA